jgi:D-alanyl-D-alanine carboxypeptidase
MSGLQEAFPLLDSFIERQMQAANTPGVAVAVTDRERLLRVTTHGWADVAAHIPVTPDTLFEIGSITKSFTIITLMQLREAGQVDLHAPVTHYLPWFQIASKCEPITLHHLMSHTAGIIRGTEFTTEARYEVWALRETEATAPPGTYFHYSNVGYKVLGLVLEELLGQSYGEIIQERILDPLGVTATDAVITHETRQHLAVGYESFYDDRPAHPSHPLVPATWLETATADGSIAATAADMATYLRMLMNRGRGPHGHILSEGSFRLMTQRVIEVPDEDGTYGYGLGIGESEGHTTIGHGGGMVGYYSAVLADMDDGLGVVVLTNGPGEPPEMARFALKLLRAAFHDQELPPLPVPDPTRIENATEYAGTYRAGTRRFILVDEGEHLVMQCGNEHIALERRGPDGFYVPHPEFALFLLRFGREEGQVVEALHGPDWYTNERYTGPATFDHPQEWLAYPGHYRSHNPWFSNFRVVWRKGALVLTSPGGDELPMVPLGNGVFRVGKEEQSPERIRFDTVLEGQALRANLSCCDYYRTFTP